MLLEYEGMPEPSVVALLSLKDARYTLMQYPKVENCMMTVSPAKTKRGIQKSAKLFSWLMWHVAPKRNETPLKTRRITRPTMGIPQPRAWENHM